MSVMLCDIFHCCMLLLHRACIWCRQHINHVYGAWLWAAAVSQLHLWQLANKAAHRGWTRNQRRQHKISDDSCMARVLTTTIVLLQCMFGLVSLHNMNYCMH